MKTTIRISLCILFCALLGFAQTPLPKFTLGAGIGFDSNAPVATAATSAPAWTQQLNGWTSFGIKADTMTYSYNTIRMVGNQYTLTPGLMRINYQSGYVTLGTVLDAGIVSSQSATGGTVQLGEAVFYNLGGANKKLANWYLTGVVKAQYASVTPMPASGYAIKPVFEFGLTLGVQ
jgi:hypothetical protein